MFNDSNDAGHLLHHGRLGVVEQGILRRSAHRRGGQIDHHRTVEHRHQRAVEIALFGELEEGLFLGIALQGERAVLAHLHRVHLVGLEIAVVDHRLTGGGFTFHHILLCGGAERKGCERQGKYQFLHVVTVLEGRLGQKYVFL